eukprot:619730-Rhodomonas_salina.1
MVTRSKFGDICCTPSYPADSRCATRVPGSPGITISITRTRSFVGPAVQTSSSTTRRNPVRKGSVTLCRAPAQVKTGMIIGIPTR